MSKNLFFLGVSVPSLRIRIQDYLSDLERGEIKSKSDFSDRVLEAVKEEALVLVDAAPVDKLFRHMDTFHDGTRIAKDSVGDFIQRFLK